MEQESGSGGVNDSGLGQEVSTMAQGGVLEPWIQPLASFLFGSGGATMGQEGVLGSYFIQWDQLQQVNMHHTVDSGLGQEVSTMAQGGVLEPW
jgi:hypothetical protein